MRRCGTSNMRLLLISPLHKNENQVSGGIANWSRNFLNNHIITSQIEVSIVNTKLIGRRSAGSTKYSYHEEAFRLCRNILTLFTKLALKKPDIVHLNTSCSNFGLVRDSIFSSIVKVFNKPLVVHFHCNVAYYSYSQKAFSCLSRLVCRADKLLVLNKPSQEYLIEKFGKESEILPLYIPNDELEQITPRKVADTIKCIIFVGHVSENKGCDIILKLAEMLPQVNILMIGHVFNEFKVKYKIPHNVVMTGNIPHSEIKIYLGKADLFLFPSKTEGFPTAVLESMAFGLPIVASGVGAIPDMIGTNGEGGIIVESREPNLFYRAIKMLDASIEKRQAMSKWNQKKVTSCYTESLVLEKLMRIYRELI